MSKNFWRGIILVIIGVLFILDNLQVIQFGDFIRTFWPALLILWGFRVLTRRGTNPSSRVRPDHNDDSRENVPADRINYSSIMRDVRLRVSSKAFRGGVISTVFGSADIDLSDVGLAQGENTLKVSGVFGGALISLPRGIPVSFSSSTLFGTVQFNDERRGGFSAGIDYVSPGYAAGPARVRIEASEVFGDIVIHT